MNTKQKNNKLYKRIAVWSLVLTMTLCSYSPNAFAIAKDIDESVIDNTQIKTIEPVKSDNENIDILSDNNEKKEVTFKTPVQDKNADNPKDEDTNKEDSNIGDSEAAKPEATNDNEKLDNSKKDNDKKDQVKEEEEDDEPMNSEDNSPKLEATLVKELTPEEIKAKKEEEKLLALVERLTPMSTFIKAATTPSDPSLQEGQLSVDKKAYPNSKYIWDMELTLNGKDRISSTDVVLVLDRSGSMSGTKLANLKLASNDMIDELIPTSGEGNINIGIVSYAQNTVVTSQTNNVTTLKATISGLSASGGTFTQAGIYEARKLLNSSSAENKFIVVLSDGQATYSYDVKDEWRSHTQAVSGEDYYETDANMPTSCIDYNTQIGSGSSTIAYLDTFAGKNYYINNNNQAISEANIAHNGGIDIFSVALNLSDTTSMDAIGIDGSYTANTQNLGAVFSSIATKINFAASNAVIVDPVGDKFTIPGITSANADQKITVYDKNDNQLTNAVITYDEGTKTFSAAIGNVTEGLSPIKIKYQVEIDHDAEPGVLFPTNLRTYVEYVDSNGDNTSKDFTPIPKVGINAATITTYNLFVDASGNLLKTEVANYGQPAINEYDAIINSDFINKIDGDPLELDKDYTITLPNEIITNNGKSYKYLSMTQAVGTNSVPLNVNGITTTVNFDSYTNKDLFYTFVEADISKVTFKAELLNGSVVGTIQDGSASPTDLIEKTYIEGTPLTSANVPTVNTNSGYSFIGWSPVLGNANDGDVYTAKWQKESTKWFTLTYDANGGSGTMDDENRLAGDTLALSENLYTYDGYYFDGWKLEENGTSTNYTDEADFEMPANNVTLVAQWVKYYDDFADVNYVADSNGTLSGITEYYVPIASIIGDVAPAPTPVPNSGYKFSKWLPTYDSSKIVADYLNMDEETPTQDEEYIQSITFTAYFSKTGGSGGDDNYDINTYVQDGSIIGASSFTAYENENVELSPVEPYDGYILDTFKVNVNGTNTIDYKYDPSISEILPANLVKDGDQYKYTVENIQGDTDVYFTFIEDTGTTEDEEVIPEEKPTTPTTPIIGEPEGTVIENDTGTIESVDNAVQTSDDFQLGPWLFILLLSSLVLAFILRKKYKKS